jgi:tetratricopeptide (TPR) repeat protein
MNEHDEELKHQHAEWKAPEQETKSGSGELKADSESVEQSSLAEWAKLNGSNVELSIKPGASLFEKEKVYDAVFREGQKRLLTELSDSRNGEVRLVDKLGLRHFKAELDTLRESGDIQALGKREAEVARLFQQAISEYPYNMETCHIAEILNKKEMNCVGASVLGGALLDEVGIKYQVGHIGSHVLLITITSDGRVWWQDMQDGLEISEIQNEELTADKMEGVTPSEVAGFANHPTKEGLKFSVKKEYWNGLSLALAQPNIGLELQELISTGFIMGNSGRNEEAIEVLKLAEFKSPNDADIHLGLARAYKNEGRYTEAVNACNKALKLDPDNNYLEGVLNEFKTLAADTNS